MQVKAEANFVRYSPYKLRLIVDVVRGKSALHAVNILKTLPVGKRVVPVRKVLESAIANAKNLGTTDLATLKIKDIRVDQGPIFKYYKPGAQGRSVIQRKRLSHIRVVLENIES